MLSLLLSLCIVASLGVVGFLSYRSLVLRYQRESVVNQIVAALHYARSLAMAAGKPTYLCPVSISNACGDKWRAGQLVMVNDAVYRHYPLVLPTVSVFFRSRLGLDSRIIFDADGLVHGAQGSFWVCGIGRQGRSVQIVLLHTGRVRLMSHDHCG